MDRNLHAAFWSDSPSPQESRYRITHHKRTKQRVNRQEPQERQQRQQQQEQQQLQWERLHYLEKWTWEEILDGKGPWEQPGDYCRPKAELEAAKAERRHYEELARQSGWKPESQPQKCIGGWLTGSIAMPGKRLAQTPCAYRGAIETGQAPCYAVVRTVSPVRVHSPVRYIPAPRISRTRLSVEPNAMKPALRIWSPVRLLEPAYMAPALRLVSPVRLHSPVRAAALAGRPRVFNQVRLGRLGAQELQCACTVRSIQYHLHASALRWPLPARGILCVSLAQYHQCRHHIPGLQCASPVQRCQSFA